MVIFPLRYVQAHLGKSFTVCNQSLLLYLYETRKKIAKHTALDENDLSSVGK